MSLSASCQFVVMVLLGPVRLLCPLLRPRLPGRLGVVWISGVQSRVQMLSRGRGRPFLPVITSNHWWKSPVALRVFPWS